MGAALAVEDRIREPEPAVAIALEGGHGVVVLGTDVNALAVGCRRDLEGASKTVHTAHVRRTSR